MMWARCWIGRGSLSALATTAEPLMQRLGVASTARASFAAYNTLEEVEQLAKAVKAVQEFFA